MIRHFIAVKFCNKRLQCVVFYESHLAIIKWENCSRQECFMMIEVTPVMFSVSADLGWDHHDHIVIIMKQISLYNRMINPPGVASSGMMAV